MRANMKKNKNALRRVKLPQHEIGGRNVFADIGMPDAELELAKAGVAAAILARINSLELNQSQAAARMGIDQPRVSRIKGGRLGEFALGTLFQFALKLGIDFKIEVGHEKSSRKPGRLSIRGDLVAL
jgi:predicted XRE-type DNA-binding protein